MATAAEALEKLTAAITERFGGLPAEGEQVDQAELQAMIDEALEGLDEEPEKFADEEPPPGPAPDQTAATPDSEAVEKLLAESQREGSQQLAAIARQAIARYVRRTGAGGQLFTTEERSRLADVLGRSLAVADLLGRSRMLLRSGALAAGPVEKFADVPTNFEVVPVAAVKMQPPAKALEYFNNLVPGLELNPRWWLPGVERTAFSLAVTTEQQLLSKVQEAISQAITTGEHGWGPQAVQDLLDAAGVSHRNPQYAEMVFRTNAKDAMAQGSQDELADPEVADVFPVWKYSAIVGDGRGRPTHSARNGNYYPSSVKFTDVRGAEPGDVCNCRCDFIAIDRWEWEDLQAKGARLADGYQ